MRQQTRESRLSEWAELVGAEVPETDRTDRLRTEQVGIDREGLDAETDDPT